MSTLAGTPAPSSSPGAVASPVPSLGDIVWATAADPITNAPLDDIATVLPDAPRIAAYVLASGLPAGSTIQADWEYNNTSLDAFAQQIVVPATTGQTWLSFHIDRGELETWPAGIYAVAISLDGQVVRQSSVEVAAPP